MRARQLGPWLQCWIFDALAPQPAWVSLAIEQHNGVWRTKDSMIKLQLGDVLIHDPAAYRSCRIESKEGFTQGWQLQSS